MQQQTDESQDYLSRVVAMLGGWPDYFGDMEIEHGKSILTVTIARRTIDQAVFGLVIRYALHRAAFDKISAEILQKEIERIAGGEKELITESSYLSGKEQQRAFHENKTAILERELLATPYSRAKSGERVQTDFLSLLDVQAGSPDGGPDGKKANTVTPFKPLVKKIYGKP